MSDQTDKISLQLQLFGLSKEEVKIYLYLLEKGLQSALSISRVLRLPRTRVYRLLDKLAEKALILQKLDTTGLKFTAASPKQFELLITQRQAELALLEKS